MVIFGEQIKTLSGNVAEIQAAKNGKRSKRFQANRVHLNFPPHKDTSIIYDEFIFL